MANFLSNIFGRKSPSFIGVDVGSSSIKVVQLTKKNGQAVLESYGELALGPYAGVEVGRGTNLPPEKIAEALRDVIRESKITAQSAGLSIPFGSSLITAIEMPANAQKQFDQMIPLEARKYIPVPMTEVALDWWILPKQNDKQVPVAGQKPVPTAEDKVDVLLVAIHNQTLEKYQTIINATGLSTTFFEIEIFSAIRSVSDQEPTSQMIIDLGANSSKVYIVEAGIVRTSHVVNKGSQDITVALSKTLNVSLEQAEMMKRNLTQVPQDRQKDATSVISSILDYILHEAHEVIQSYQRKYNKSVTKGWLVGGGAMLRGVLTYAEEHLQIKVFLGDPFGRTVAPSFLSEMLKNTGPEFAVAVGIALRKLGENN